MTIAVLIFLGFVLVVHVAELIMEPNLPDLFFLGTLAFMIPAAWAELQPKPLTNLGCAFAVLAAVSLFACRKAASR